MTPPVVEPLREEVAAAEPEPEATEAAPAPDLHMLVGNQALLQALAPQAPEPDERAPEEEVPAPEGEPPAAQAQPPPAEAAVAPETVAAEVLPAAEAAAEPPMPEPPDAPMAPGEWRAQAGRAIDSLPEPVMPEPGAADQALRRRGFEFAAAQRAAQAADLDRARGLGRRLPAPGAARREPPEFDPVPEATRHLLDAANQPLPERPAPPLPESPLHHVPTLGARAVPPADFRTLMGRGFFVYTALPPDNPERRRLDELRARLEPPAPEASATAAGAAAPAVPPIPAEPARPPIVFPPAVREDLTQLYARLLADLPAQALQVMSFLRRHVYGTGTRPEPGVVDTVYSDLGNGRFLDEVQAGLEARVRGLALDADIARGELDLRVDQRRAGLVQDTTAEHVSMSLGADGAGETVRAAAQRRLGASAAVAGGLDAHARRLREEARRVPTRSQVPATETRLLDATNQFAAEQVAGYRAQGEARVARLNQLKDAYQQAFELAAQQDESQLRREAGTEVESRAVQDRIRASRAWSAEATRTAHQALDTLIAEVQPLVTGLQDAVRQAAAAKREALRTWADGRLNRERTAGDRVVALVNDAEAATAREANEYRELQNQRVSAGVAVDLQLIRDVQADVEAGLDQAAILAARGVDERRREIIEAWFTGTGAPESRVLDLVAGQVRDLFATEQLPLVAQIEPLVLEQHGGDLAGLQRIATTLNPNFDVDQRRNDVRGGITYFWGTDEDRIFRALANLSAIEVRVLELSYAATYDGDDLREDLAGDLSGREQERADALMESRQDRADAIAARQAMYGNWETYGLGSAGIAPDADTLLDLSYDPDSAQAMGTAYTELFGGDLARDSSRTLMRDRDQQRLALQLSGRTYEAEAIALRDAMPTEIEAMDRHIPPIGDRDAIRAVYDRIRRTATAEAARRGWTTSELEAEIDQRNRAVERAFNARYARDYGDAPAGALRAAHEHSFAHSAADRMVVTGLADNDLSLVDAGLVQREREDLWSDNRAINDVVAAQYQRAREATQRDQMPIRGALMARELADLERREGPLSPARYWQERERLRREADRAIEQAARPEGMANLNRLRTTFREHTRDDLDAVVLDETSSFGQWFAYGRQYDRDEAATLLAQGGYLTPAQQVHFAIAGAGTREDALKAALKGRTASELDDIATEYSLLGYGTDMFAEIRDELSGRDAFDVDQMLKGAPETVEQRVQRLQEAVAYEDQVGALGKAVASDEARQLRAQLRTLEEQQQRMADPAVTPAERDLLVAEFDQMASAVEQGVQVHREALDSALSVLTTIVGIAVAIGVGLLTGGMGLAAAAALASAIGTATTIGLKYLVLGPQYGWEDLGVDLAVGVVDAAMAALTAGMGEALLGTLGKQAATAGVLARGVPVSRVLTQLAERGPLARGLAKLLASGAENLVQNVPSALTGSLLDDRNWERGNPVRNILAGTLRQSATSVGMGMAFHLGKAAGGRLVGGLGELARKGFGRFARPPHSTVPAPHLEITPVRGAPEPPRPPRRAAVDRATMPAERVLLHDPELEAALPERLVASTPVAVDPSLPGRTVQVEYTRGRGGRPRELFIVAGPDATPADVLLHVPTLQAMRRYVGLLGAVLQTRDAFRRLVGRNGRPRPGTLGWESSFEVEKLPGVIDSRMGELERLPAGAPGRARLVAEIDQLRAELREHQQVLADLRDDPGRGFVAARGVKEPPIQERGKPAPSRLDDNTTYPIENSTLRTEYPDAKTHTIRQVGPSYYAMYEGRMRRYRFVEVVDPNGVRVDLRGEIYMTKSRTWRPRGSEANVSGRVAELASRALSLERFKSTPDVDYVHVPQHLTQKAGGQGFDQVVIAFYRKAGKVVGARIIVLEVKNYPGRYVPLAEFTAVRGKILNDNLRDLLTHITAGRLKLEAPQRLAAIKAIGDNHLDLELRLTEKTRLGEKGTPGASVVERLENDFSRGEVRVERIPEPEMDRAWKDVEAADWLGSTRRERTLAREPVTNQLETGRRAPAQTAAFVEVASPPALKGPLQPTARPDVFLDTAGGWVHTLHGGEQPGAAAIDALAGEAAGRLREAPNRPPGATRDAQVVIDVTGMTAGQRQRLVDQLQARLAGTPKLLDRVLLAHRELRTLTPVPRS